MSTTRLSQFASILALLTCFVLCVNDAASVLAQPQDRPIPVVGGPPIGISAAPFSMSTPTGVIQGVRVIQDFRHRHLFRNDPSSSGMHYHFRTGYDVILRVNGNPVYNASDVLANTHYGWNYLLIWDRQTGTTGVYRVHLD